LLDCIPFGPNPTARATSLVRLERWDDAEVAFDEVARARPFNYLAWADRGRFHLGRCQPEKAVADFRQAVALQPGDVAIRYHDILALATVGDLSGLRREASDLLDRFRKTTDPDTANQVAWSLVLAPGMVTDKAGPVRLAEIAVKGFAAEQKSQGLNTLGAALYRASRFEEAIRRLEEGIRLQNGTSLPQDWTFLAMAHHRLGHRDESRRWLDQLRGYQPSADPGQFWNELEIRLLRSEAEAAILIDPIFPADPFAH
jgi:tetratricopeptide (TPR) repeat protein